MPRRSRSNASTSPGLSPKRTRRHAPAASTRAGRDHALGGEDQGGRRINVPADVASLNKVLRNIEPETEGTELRARGLNLYADKNRSEHHTEPCELEGLIVRRGQAFSIQVTFSREYNKEADTIVLQLATGNNPKESKDTVLRIPVVAEPVTDLDDWSASVTSSQENTVDISVIPSADAIIGYYHIYVETLTEGPNDTRLQYRREFDDTFLVLFNAWCKDDLVYVDDEDQRQEYVMNEVGRIWTGTRHDYGGMPWNFGQFEDVCMEAALYLLDKAELSEGARSNPSAVIRCMSAMANCNDEDNGVLYGRWTDTYPKGSTVPWAWSGSVAILEEYMKTKEAVCFGQCWVFSGLVTTLLRAVGIPTRSVTNFESAHDTDSSMTIDFHWGEDDEPMTDMNDSVWNFHVWNESFFKRPDLPEGYDGWQAHDATPQEESEGVMRCGPCSVQAIKEGLVYLPNDGAFIFAEVNGDKVHWLVKEDGSMDVLRKETNAVGHCISTKAVGSNSRHDVTGDYKFKADSVEERKAVRRAFRYSTRRKHRVYDVPEPDVRFELDSPKSVAIGNDFTIKVKLKNLAKETRRVHIALSAISTYYTGVPSDKIGTQTFTESLAAEEEKECSLEITHEMYQGFLKPESLVTIYMKGSVMETKRAYADMDTFPVIKPGLQVQVPDEVFLGQPFDVTVSFTNPLKEKLTGGVLHIEGQRAIKAVTTHIRKSVPPGEEFSHVLSLTANRSGTKELIINFSCDQLSGLVGTADIQVQYGE